METRAVAHAWFVGVAVGTLVVSAWAQERSEPAPSGSAPIAPAAPESPALAQADLEELLGPIALYPDQLLANILAASMYPDEVRAAAEFAKSAPSAAQIEAMDWEPPVRAVALVPNVIKMMGEYPDWVASLGAAYANQPRDVMSSVQALRAKAQTNGALFDTAEQKVTTQDGAILIQPAQPEIVYVPQYNPQVIYVERYDPWAPGFITFGWGVWTGFWLSDLDCDWYRSSVCWGNSWKRRDGCDWGAHANANDWRGRPRPGQEGSRWAPNEGRTRFAGDRSTARFRGFDGAASRTSAAFDPRMGPSRPGDVAQGSGRSSTPPTGSQPARSGRTTPRIPQQASAATGRVFDSPATPPVTNGASQVRTSAPPRTGTFAKPPSPATLAQAPSKRPANTATYVPSGKSPQAAVTGSNSSPVRSGTFSRPPTSAAPYSAGAYSGPTQRSTAGASSPRGGTAAASSSRPTPTTSTFRGAPSVKSAPSAAPSRSGTFGAGGATRSSGGASGMGPRQSGAGGSRR